MKKVLVDTNLFIDEIRKGSGVLTGLLTRHEKGEVELFVSSFVIFELYVGLRGHDKQKTLVEDMISPFKVVDFDSDVAKLAANLLRQNSNLKNIPLIDFLIGCEALFVKAQVATYNTKHFVSIPGLKLHTI